MPTKRRVDLTNLLNSTLDLLVQYGIILDDNRNIVYSVDGSRVLYDKAFPRTEIEITPITESVESWVKK
jgi:Holliday junction resolvase RusA-like endonuclease